MPETAVLPQTAAEREHDRRALQFVMLAGCTLLENGAEVARVHETMTIMAAGFGIAGYNDYVLTNGIFASVSGETHSEVRSVREHTVHLGRVEAVNEISREIEAGRLTLEQAEERLAQARRLPPPSARAQILASACGSFCFTLLFGGSFAEAAVSLAAGALLGAYLLLCERHGVAAMVRRLSGAALITVLCLAGAALIPGVGVSAAVIGTLMVLTPGVAITMGIRDFLCADYLSGTIRLIDAFLIAGSIACGTGLVLWACSWLTGVTL